MFLFFIVYLSKILLHPNISKEKSIFCAFFTRKIIKNDNIVKWQSIKASKRQSDLSATVVRYRLLKLFFAIDSYPL